jgi:hypothetical protein
MTLVFETNAPHLIIFRNSRFMALLAYQFRKFARDYECVNASPHKIDTKFEGFTP